jgi:Carboxylesterase family
LAIEDLQYVYTPADFWQSVDIAVSSGITHGAEITYVFGFPKMINNPAVTVDIHEFSNMTNCTADDIAFSDYMMTLWTNFAKYGWEYVVHFEFHDCSCSLSKSLSRQLLDYFTFITLHYVQYFEEALVKELQSHVKKNC